MPVVGSSRGGSRDDIFQKALSFQDTDTADLIGVLIHSLDAEVEEGVEEGWRIEIDRRAKELELGAGQSIPWEIVRQRLARAPRG